MYWPIVSVHPSVELRNDLRREKKSWENVWGVDRPYIGSAKSELELYFSAETETAIKTVLSHDVFRHNILEAACYAVFFLHYSRLKTLL